MRIKHKLANRPAWSRILERRFHCVRVDEPFFTGFVTRLDLVKVKKPLYVYMHHRRLKIVDDQYIWLMLFPDQKHYSLTVVMDEARQIVQCYFDVVKENVLNEEGIPGFDDLFLDVVFTESDSILLDEEDLSAALRAGIVDADTADMAYFTALRILKEGQGHFEELKQWVLKCGASLLTE